MSRSLGLQRAKEIARNKKERKFLRDAHKMKSDPTALKEELKEVHIWRTPLVLMEWHLFLVLMSLVTYRLSPQ